MKIEHTVKRPAGIEEVYLGRWVDGKDAGSGASLEIVNRTRIASSQRCAPTWARPARQSNEEVTDQ